MLKEKEIEKNILEFLSNCSLFAWKNQSQGTFDYKKGIFRTKTNKYAINGVSDILGLLPTGKLFAIEVKSKIGKPSDDQKKFIRLIQDNFGISFISRGVWQTYTQMLPFWPEIKAFEHIAKQYQQIEENSQPRRTRESSKH